jgi:hypothetical protein
VKERGFEARARPEAEHRDQQDQGLGGAAPAEVVQEVVGELGDGEDEDQVEKSSSGETASRWTDCAGEVIAFGWRAQGGRCRSCFLGSLDRR